MIHVQYLAQNYVIVNVSRITASTRVHFGNVHCTSIEPSNAAVEL